MTMDMATRTNNCLPATGSKISGPTSPQPAVDDTFYTNLEELIEDGWTCDPVSTICPYSSFTSNIQQPWDTPLAMTTR